MNLPNTLRIALTAAVATLAWAGPASAAGCTVKVGRVLPMTGALAAAAQVHPWIDNYKVGQLNKKGGLIIGGQHCDIEFKYYDSQSTPAGSGAAATKAIIQDRVNVVMASFTPDTTNQPTAMCEKYEVPCITTGAPIESWLLGPDGTPRDTEFGFHFFFQVPALVRNHVDTLKAIPGGFNGKIGYLYPNDPDGLVFHSLFEPAFAKENWHGVDPGRFEMGLADFSPIVAKFKAAGVEAVTGVLTPPDLAKFLTAASKAGFKPKVYLIDKATGFADAMASMGSLAEGVAGADFWSGAFPGHATYGGYDAKALINAYETANPGKYYSPLLGLDDAALDVLFDALSRSANTSPEAIVKALKATSIDTVAGKIVFNQHNYAAIPIGTGQWHRDTKTGRWVKDTVFSDFPGMEKTGQMHLYQGN